ncbi:alpha/beta hydrolase [Bacillus sp. 31A1R]|uniref:Alpha/beta hydrolase n=1 Tax=Robertmurraya mangrovi TaxID=3098077 RepID=A0ABU5J0C4_9BACI|nr:alpha/beta hydrolase [Bacillus sp. 31A1R]MDZ5472863.1 alpha/beta hydrolase [Bacillus sp. 31A1R]
MNTIQSQSGFLEINGTDLYYEIKGTGYPLLMIHGNPLDCRMWEPQFNEFSKHFQVIRFDLAGFGQSGVHHHDFSLIEDIKRLLDSLEIKQTNILGFSVGGMLSMDFSILYPEMVNKLIVASTGLLGWSEFSLERQKFNEELNLASNTRDQNLVIQLMTEGWVAGPFRELDEVEQGVPSIFVEMVRNNFSKEKGKGSMILPTTKTIDLVSEIKAPTLIITPEMDFPEFIAIANYLNKKIIDSTIVHIPGTAHMINMEKPVDFNQRVIEFLS